MERRGQTAIEYLLIVVLVIAVVVIIVVWNQGFSSGLEDTTMNQAGDVICATTECTPGGGECDISACGGSGVCVVVDPDADSGFCQKV